MQQALTTPAPARLPNRQAAPMPGVVSLNPIGIPSTAQERSVGLPSIHSLFGGPSPKQLSTALPPIHTSPSRHASRQNSDNLFEPQFSSTLAIRRTSISRGGSPRQGQNARLRYSPLVPAQRLSDRAEVRGGRRYSQPYIKTISTSTTSSSGLRLSPTKSSGVLGRDDGGWPRSAISVGDETARTPRPEDDRQSINLQ